MFSSLRTRRFFGLFSSLAGIVITRVSIWRKETLKISLDFVAVEINAG